MLSRGLDIMSCNVDIIPSVNRRPCRRPKRSTARSPCPATASRSAASYARTVRMAELAPPQRVYSSWWASANHCTHGLLCRNTGRAARETSDAFLQNYNREHGLQLTIEHLDQEMLECMRLLPSDSEYVYRALLCLRAYRGGALPSTVCTSVARFVA